MIRLLVALVFAVASHVAYAVVNLNTATKEELVAVSGIGPARAQAILDYRAQHGAFKSVEELKDVKGIGARRYEKLKAEFGVVAPQGKPAPAPKASAAANGSPRGDARSQTLAIRNDAKPAK